MYKLGMFFYDVHAVSENIAEASAWFRKAAERGLTHAHLGLGAMYYYGARVEQDYHEAARHIQVASNADIAEPQYWISKLAEKGIKIDEPSIPSLGEGASGEQAGETSEPVTNHWED